eukprot:TRINITY_DN8490_c0_g1_i6.p1 TRINITY_DN8490_c0_g1~~TRINITY_DN8490_c0_g1_i6.p1  ORF type:complete len:600 (-),score=96.55 TRINITY_DN8490_c0_g1_i6:346-2145(-)
MLEGTSDPHLQSGAAPPAAHTAPVPPPFTAGAARRRHRRGGNARLSGLPTVTPLWKTQMCDFWVAGMCRKGAACSYAHGEEDLRPSPDFERTSVCPNFVKDGKCDRPGCRYAHSYDELRVDPGLLKSKMCSFFLHGQCVVGEACRFAHSTYELQQALALLSNVAEASPPSAPSALPPGALTQEVPRLVTDPLTGRSRSIASSDCSSKPVLHLADALKSGSWSVRSTESEERHEFQKGWKQDSYLPMHAAREKEQILADNLLKAELSEVGASSQEAADSADKPAQFRREHGAVDEKAVEPPTAPIPKLSNRPLSRLVEEEPCLSPPLEPMKVVIAAAWEEDLTGDAGSAAPAVSSLKPGNPSKDPLKKAVVRRSKAQRVLVDTQADLDTLLDDKTSSVSVTSQTKSIGERVVVNESTGLLDLGARKRQPVVVLDIEDAQEICQGCNKFVVRDPQKDIEVQLVQIHRRRARSQRAEASARSSSMPRARAHTAPDRRWKASSTATDNAGDVPPTLGAALLPAADPVEGRESTTCFSSSTCRLGYGSPCDAPPTSCPMCSGKAKRCAACDHGLKVRNQNTFLTFEDGDEDLDGPIPFRRTKSL